MVMNFLNGNVNEAIKTQIKYIDFVRAMFIETNPAPIKEAMNIMGFNVGECRSPLGPLSEKNREHVKNIINKYGLKK
ncbi:dihydrodipicolinate synthase family protein [Brachyspira hyodysenteriae]|nr:dihydrodipicolinate synthase family protein [Brachyspira hyodysenteriae]